MIVKKRENKKWYFYRIYKDTMTNKYKDYKRLDFKPKQESKFTESEFLKTFLIHPKRKLSDSSYNSLVNKINKHIRPYFDNTDIKDIKTWKDETNAKNHSQKYKRDIFIILSTIFNFSEKYYETDNNCLEIEENFKDPAEHKKKMLFWTIKEF
ncbi:tyrosine-type recombinase/integrase [Longibaculum muris]|uniref:hypothetical protein n=1 Tax=Longibaculum muris TaxID=1796628 RepID=UPI0022E0E61A|nr:hypothetical protein [Longibaculum muris]